METKEPKGLIVKYRTPVSSPLKGFSMMSKAGFGEWAEDPEDPCTILA